MKRLLCCFVLFALLSACVPAQNSSVSSAPESVSSKSELPLPEPSSSSEEKPLFVPAHNAVRPSAEEIASEEYWLTHYYYEINQIALHNQSNTSIDLPSILEWRISKGMLSVEHLNIIQPYNNGVDFVVMPPDQFRYWMQKIAGKSYADLYFSTTFPHSFELELFENNSRISAPSNIRVSKISAENPDEISILLQRMLSFEKNVVDEQWYAVMEWDEQAGYVVKNASHTQFFDTGYPLIHGSYTPWESKEPPPPKEMKVQQNWLSGQCENPYAFYLSEEGEIIHSTGFPAQYQTLPLPEKGTTLDIFQQDNDTFNILMEKNLYRWDAETNSVTTYPLPAFFSKRGTEHPEAFDFDRFIAISPDYRFLSLAGKAGVYLCPLTADGVPRLIRENPPPRENPDFSDYLYPMQFLEGDRLLLRAISWEWSPYSEIIDLNGNLLSTIDINLNYGNAWYGFEGGAYVYGGSELLAVDYKTGLIEDHKWIAEKMPSKSPLNFDLLVLESQPWKVVLVATESEERTYFPTSKTYLVDLKQKSIQELFLWSEGAEIDPVWVNETEFAFGYRGDSKYGGGIFTYA